MYISALNTTLQKEQQQQQQQQQDNNNTVKKESNAFNKATFIFWCITLYHNI
jgi:hypothetical protein